MKPALSVIFFTVSSGAGLGLMVWMLVAQLAGRVSGDSGEFLAGAALSAVLLTAGLVSSTGHLANPRNAWRAFSRVRTSWLSREGVLAVLVYPLAALHLALGWRGSALASLTGVALIVLALAVVYSTAMIYACLKTIPRWRTWHTPARYLLFALASGLLLWIAIAGAGAALPRGAAVGLAALLAVAVGLVEVVHALAFAAPRTATLNDALAVPASAPRGHVQGRVRLLDVGHTHGTFLTNEFGFRLARERARLLRRIMLVLVAPLPIALLAIAPGAAWAAAASFVARALLERWLFFAEAEHVVRLYHGQGAV